MWAWLDHCHTVRLGWLIWMCSSVHLITTRMSVCAIVVLVGYADHTRGLLAWSASIVVDVLTIRVVSLMMTSRADLAWSSIKLMVVGTARHTTVMVVISITIHSGEAIHDVGSSSYSAKNISSLWLVIKRVGAATSGDSTATEPSSVVSLTGSATSNLRSLASTDPNRAVIVIERVWQKVL